MAETMTITSQERILCIYPARMQDGAPMVYAVIRHNDGTLREELVCCAQELTNPQFRTWQFLNVAHYQLLSEIKP